MGVVIERFPLLHPEPRRLTCGEARTVMARQLERQGWEALDAKRQRFRRGDQVLTLDIEPPPYRSEVRDSETWEPCLLDQEGDEPRLEAACMGDETFYKRCVRRSLRVVKP